MLKPSSESFASSALHDTETQKNHKMVMPSLLTSQQQRRLAMMMGRWVDCSLANAGAVKTRSHWMPTGCALMVKDKTTTGHFIAAIEQSSFLIVHVFHGARLKLG